MKKSVIKFLMVVAFYGPEGFFSSLALAGPPTSSCRVLPEVLKAHGQLVNNAGCAILRTHNKQTEILMVRVEKMGGGIGFPGGKLANTKNDANDNHALAKLGKTYVEPAVCTAARETYEETGMNVIVGELIEVQEKFILFRCYSATEDVHTIDTEEVKGSLWVSAATKSQQKFLYENGKTFDAILKKYKTP